MAKQCAHFFITMKTNFYKTRTACPAGVFRSSPESYTFVCSDCGKERVVESFIKDTTINWAQRVLENTNE